jgi:hypothetical protein
MITRTNRTSKRMTKFYKLASGTDNN